MFRRYPLPPIAALLLPLVFSVALSLAGASPARAAEVHLKPGDLVAIVGDSITEQKQYSVFMQDYFLMCQPQPDLQAVQFGWSGERAPSFEKRMENDMLRFKPTVMTTCYGMNDGGYAPITADVAKAYRWGQTNIVERAKRAGVRTIVVGSAGPVDSDTYKNNPETAIMYNKTLAAERDIAKEVAAAKGVVFADVFTPMMDVMTKAKVKYGKQYHVCGPDGVHPAQNGHLVMAYAFLKALGCTGEIGAIRVDLTSGKAETTDGHKVLNTSGSSVELESTRYPFCFYGEPANPSSTTGIIEFLPFNQELNRLILTTTGAKAEQYTVTWGPASKTFSAKQLSEGVNLAAEFIDNPFSKPFQQVEAEIRNQQSFETPLIKSLITKLPELKQMVPDEAEALDRIINKTIKHDEELRVKSRAAVQPVRHTLKIEAAK